MANVLDSIIANQPIKPAKKQVKNTAYTFTSEGKIKPMKDKGRLLPSKIFDSPIDIAKDLKGDIVSIGKAAKGKANDHELGRINDLAMKLGSVALASYLFVKNPFKLNKAMEFIGAGTFFAGMSLWPKLMIQAPVKARTGVDVHQKYIDSQGRKKMLFQDPQYVLTDLYSKEDIDKMGKKLDVAENIPDRDNVIKQRAQKTALQSNTLWMMTAGPATPLISALACNRLEQPVNTLIEQTNLLSSKEKLNGVLNTPEKLKMMDKVKGAFSNLAQKLDDASFERYLSKNAGKTLDRNTAKELAAKLGAKAGSETLEKGITEKLLSLIPEGKLDISSIRTALTDKVDDTIIAALDGLVDSKVLKDAVASGDADKIAQTLTNAYNRSLSEKMDKATRTETTNKIAKAIKQAQVNAKSNSGVTLGSIADDVKNLRTSVSGFASKHGKLNKFISARVGDQPNTFIANQWDRVCNSFIKALNLDSKELEALSNGKLDDIASKLDDLVVNDAKYEKLITKLMKMIGDYETETGKKAFSSAIADASSKISAGSQEAMKAGLGDGAEKIMKDITTEVTEHAANRAAGARSSFYRLVQTLDVFKRAVPGQNNAPSKLAQQLEASLRTNAPDLTDDALKTTVDKLVQISKKVMLSAGSTDYVEKLTTQGYNLSTAEYKAVMSALFDAENSSIKSTLKKSMSAERTSKLVGGLKEYQDDFLAKVADWKNNMTSNLGSRTIAGGTSSLNSKERANLVAKPVNALLEETAKKKFNSNKWFKIFGISLAVLSAVTLVAGLLVGRKGDTEKQVEAESKKVNG